MNKSNKKIEGEIALNSNNESLKIINSAQDFSINPGVIKEVIVFVSGENSNKESISHLDFIIKSNNGIFIYKSNFITP